MSEAIKRQSKCPFCRRGFSRSGWAVKHVTTCTKWPYEFDRPVVEEVEGELRIKGHAHVHLLPGMWTYITHEPDRQKAIAEFLTMKRPRRPGLVQHPSVESLPYQAGKYEKRKRNE